MCLSSLKGEIMFQQIIDSPETAYSSVVRSRPVQNFGLLSVGRILICNWSTGNICLYSSKEQTEFVAVGKECRDLGLTAIDEILGWVFPFPVVFFFLSFPLKLCFVYTHNLDSFYICEQRSIADKPYLVCTAKFPIYRPEEA